MLVDVELAVRLADDHRTELTAHSAARPPRAGAATRPTATCIQQIAVPTASPMHMQGASKLIRSISNATDEDPRWARPLDSIPPAL